MRKKKRIHKNVLQVAAQLFDFMVEHPKKPQVKRVNSILELLAAIRKEKRFYEKAQLLNRLHEAFRRYQWSRQILFTNDGPHEYVTAAKQSKSDDDAREYGLVGLLLTVAEYYPDYLLHIDHCEVCQRWMFILKSSHRFCSGKCRQSAYDNDPERKEKHRADMRELYRREQERERREKRAVGFVEKGKKAARKSSARKKS